VLLAQDIFRDHYYGIHAKHTGSRLEGFKSPEEDSDKQEVHNPLDLSSISQVFPSCKSASAKEEFFGPSRDIFVLNLISPVELTRETLPVDDKAIFEGGVIQIIFDTK